jgi:hypothetical protein
MGSRHQSNGRFVRVGSLLLVNDVRPGHGCYVSYPRVCNQAWSLNLHHLLNELDATYSDGNGCTVHSLEKVQFDVGQVLP